jgi:hypothetical protein
MSSTRASGGEGIGRILRSAALPGTGSGGAALVPRQITGRENDRVTSGIELIERVGRWMLAAARPASRVCNDDSRD